MKKVLKRSLSFFLAITIIFSSAYVGFAEVDFDGLFVVKTKAATSSGTTGDCTWTLDGTVLTISGNGEMDNYGLNSILPWGTEITGVIIEDGVVNIGRYAFTYCTNLKWITIGNNVTSIGAWAFFDCAQLSSITIPDSVISISDYAFLDCTQLLSITIPDSVTTIGGYAFYNTAYYDDVSNWVDGVLYIGNHLLSVQNTITGNFLIKTGTKTIAGSAFNSLTDLTAVTIPDSVVSIGNQAFKDCTNLKFVEIGNGVTNISFRGFSGCTSLETITIPDSVTSIGEYAFANCLNLVSIKIPSQVKSISDYVFQGCISLISITISNSVTSIGNNAFRDCTRLTSITIPDSVTRIGGDAFYNTAYYNDVSNWSNDVLYIGNHLLDAKNSITGSCLIKDGTKFIAINAFYLCTNLVSVTIPNSVISIGGGAFFECTQLTSITIPDSVISIGDGVFSGCESLTSIYVDENNVNYSSVDGVLFNKDKTTLIKYPIGKTHKEYILSDSVKKIYKEAFSYCRSLASVKLTDSVKSIGDCAFAYCSNLDSFIIPNNLTKISDSVFYYCRSLSSITIPKSVSNIGNDVFYGCDNLIEVHYSGTKEEWDSITIGSSNENLLSANIIFNVSSEYAPTKVNNGIFKCVDFTYSGDSGFDYDDAYFDTPATEYNHELATMSLCLALSTFRDKDDSENSGDNVVSVLKQCGFKNEVYDTLTTEPDADSIGYALASKPLGDDTTLIVCAVRSGGYEDEWASNVTLGIQGDHNGFETASIKVAKAIRDYVASNSITGKVKIWLAGYSRGAATATQAAASLNKTGIPGIDINKDSIYAYGFATPAGAIKDNNPTDKNEYGNIFNIVHFHDLVPLVAPEDWSFGRYGTTYHLPTAETTKKIDDVEPAMVAKLNSYGLDSEEDNLFWQVSTNKDGELIGTPGLCSRGFIKLLSTIIGDRETYSVWYEVPISDIILNGIDINKPLATSILIPVVNKIIGISNRHKIAASSVLAYVEQVVASAATTHGSYGAYYMSWMQSLSSENAIDYFNEGKVRWLGISCPVNVYIYDSDDVLVASIVNEKVVEIKDGSIVYGIDENGHKAFYLPVDGEYDIRIEAREDCKTTVTINEYTSCSGTPKHIVTYTDIPMESDEVLETTVSEMVEITVDDGTTETEAEYIVEKNNEVIEPTIDIVDEEVENYTYTVNVSCDESKGIVYGGGVFTIGEFCQVEATNKPGYKFSKWTVNGETVSTESVHRFDVAEYVKNYNTDENNVTIVAEYVPCEHPNYKTEVVAPTCTDDGYTKHTCDVCTYSYNDTVVKAPGHTSSGWITDNSTGSKYKECTECDEVLETQTITVPTTKITSCYNEIKGVQLKWNAVSGTKSYKVYRKLPSQAIWVEIKTTTALAYQDTNVKGNTIYQYSVKAVDQYGNESAFSAQRECRFIETPTLLTRTNAVGGVTITWKKVAGATSYRIYRRGAGVNYWYYLGDFPATMDTFTDLETANYFPDDASKNALAKPKSGNYYRYTVRASYDGKDSAGKAYTIYSGFDTNGLYLKYVATPKLTSISNATNGLQIKWNAVAGGCPVEYRVYRRGAGSTYWYYLGTTTNTTWTDSGVKNANGGYYRYTVRAVAGTNGNGWYSAFDTTGLYLMRLANPTLKSAISTNAGITVKWSAIKGTTGYYVYRKTANSGWQKIATVRGTNNTTFVDASAKKGTTYTYTVRAVYGRTTSYFNSGISCYDKY